MLIEEAPDISIHEASTSRFPLFMQEEYVADIDTFMNNQLWNQLL